MVLVGICISSIFADCFFLAVERYMVGLWVSQLVHIHKEPRGYPWWLLGCQGGTYMVVVVGICISSIFADCGLAGHSTT